MKQFTLPAVLLAFLFLSPIRVNAVSYLEEIKPILEKNCYGCHGEEKDKGGLRLHTAEAIQESETVVAKDLDGSELLVRILLEVGHDDFMPKGAEKPLPAEDIELIKKWISEGAEYGDPEALQDAEAIKIPWIETLPEASEDVVKKLKETGALVLRLANNTQALNVDFRFRDGDTTDELLPVLAEATDQLVWLNLAGSKVTDGGLGNIAALKNLTRLHLENTEITDAGVQQLTGLERLEYLNLYGTKITDAGLEHIKSLKALKKLFLWQAPVGYEAAMALQEAVPGLVINLGEDHPGVVRVRMTKQLERSTKDIEDATKLEEQSKKDKESAEARKAEAEAKLAELDKAEGKTPPAEETAEGEAAEEKPAEEEPAEEEPAEEEPAEEEPAEEEPAEEEPAEEEPAEEEPAEEEPAEEEPAEEKPAEEEPAEEEKAE